MMLELILDFSKNQKSVADRTNPVLSNINELMSGSPHMFFLTQNVDSFMPPKDRQKTTK